MADSSCSCRGGFVSALACSQLGELLALSEHPDLGPGHPLVTLCPRDQVEEFRSCHQLLLSLSVNVADADSQRMALDMGDLGRDVLSTVGKGNSLSPRLRFSVAILPGALFLL